MNPFLLGPAERLAVWRQLRNSLIYLTEEQQLAAVAAYWAKAPLLTFAYDLERCDDWPTIWQMIHANAWCRNTVAIGMEATLRLAGMAADRLTLCLMHDRTIAAVLLVLIVDDRWVLNYDWGLFRSYPSTDHYIIWKCQYIGRGYTILHG
jgi:hypothetical protein